MNHKIATTKLAIFFAAVFTLTAAWAVLWHGNADAQGSKKFKGGRLENNQLIPDAGLKLRRVSDTLVEIIKEETTKSGSGPTARSVTKPIRVNGINVKCVCGGTTSTTNCQTTVTSGGATCKATSNGCGRCDMIATE